MKDKHIPLLKGLIKDLESVVFYLNAILREEEESDDACAGI